MFRALLLKITLLRAALYAAAAIITIIIIV